MGFFDKPEVIGPDPSGRDGQDDRVRSLEARVARLEAQVVALLAPRGDAGTPATYPAPPVPPAWLSEVLELKRRGEVVRAVKVYREHTRAGLVEAKQAVDALD